MSVMSMTGFGRGEAANETVKITVELGTVNRKQFDCAVTLPRECLSLEPALQNLIRGRITRGYVKGQILLTPVTASLAATLNLNGVREQVDAIRTVATELGLPHTLTASDLLTFPDILKPRLVPEDPQTLWPLIEQAVNLALNRLLAMRRLEGANLTADIRKRLDALRGIVDEIRALAPQVPILHKELLEKRLNDLLAPSAVIDPETLAKEVALFADRCDISEELTRLDSHFTHSVKLLTEGGACGRSLDFLCQEFFREINTIGSKANHAGIARHVIAVKAGLEAVREQVQNLE